MIDSFCLATWSPSNRVNLRNQKQLMTENALSNEKLYNIFKLPHEVSNLEWRIYYIYTDINTFNFC